MSRAAFSSFARNIGRFQSVRNCAMKGMNPMFAKLKPTANTMKFSFPEMMTKNERITQLAKLTKQSRRLCSLQLQKVHLSALSVLLTGAGEILIDFEDLINSLQEEEDEELLRRTSLLVQSQRGG